MKIPVIQSKNEIVMDVGVSIKNKMIGVLVNRIIYGISARVMVSVTKHEKLTNI